MKLWKQVLIGLSLGVIAGITLEKDVARELKVFGTIFMNLIKMVIVPLIFFALLSGITSISGEGNFTRVGIKGFSAYILTAVFAVLIGITAGHFLEPGKGVNMQELIKQTEVDNSKAFTDTLAVAKTEKSAKDFLIELIPTNPIKAMAEDKYLQIIVFTIFLGVVINMVGEKAKPLKDIINSGAAVFFKTIEIIIKLAPLGVFGYMAFSIADQGPEILRSLARLIFTVLLACLIQYIIFGFMIAFFGRISPFPFYRKIFFTQSLAFSTSSSKATLPTAMTQLQDRLGVSKTNSNFLMPLGVCINMDGTAIYLGICALFFAQGFGIDLTMQNYMMLILTCTLGSIGAAGIPSGSIIFMSMVLGSIGIPVEGIVVILGVDRVLDMVRTTINITGDSAITLIVDKTEGGLNEKLYYSKDV
jgi:Na+/H+-dicarboxylate symporter